MGRKLGAQPNFVVISETVAEILPLSIFSRWRPGFGNIKILKDRWVKGVKLHQIANFRGDWSNRGGDMAIFRFFQNGSRCVCGRWISWWTWCLAVCAVHTAKLS